MKEDTPKTKCKLCLLCLESPEFPYDDNGHGKSQTHHTLSKNWAPTKGHKDYELHLRMVELLNL